jgi:DNA-directed RNA polymerase subunit K/omega
MGSDDENDDNDEFESDNNSEDEEEDEDEDLDEELTEEINDKEININNSGIIKDKIINSKEIEEKLNQLDKQTAPIITKYELTNVLGIRATEIANGIESFVDTDKLNLSDPFEIAKYEFKKGLIPYIIVRPLPNGNMVEYWRLSDLQFNVNIKL